MLGVALLVVLLLIVDVVVVVVVVDKASPLSPRFSPHFHAFGSCSFARGMKRFGPVSSYIYCKRTPSVGLRIRDETSDESEEEKKRKIKTNQRNRENEWEVKKKERVDPGEREEEREKEKEEERGRKGGSEMEKSTEEPAESGCVKSISARGKQKRVSERKIEK